MAATSEIELKLVVLDGTPAERIARRLPGVAWERTTIDSIYFDTPDEQLRRHGIGLRVRRDGGRWLQTVKTSDRGNRLVASRGEWEVELGPARQGRSIDVQALAATPLQALIDDGRLRTDALQPVFRTRFTRRRALLERGPAGVEIAIDTGELIAAGGRRREPIAEIELELKAGEPGDVLALARLLVEPKGLVAVPSLRSKAERGYALAGRGTWPVARAAASGFARLVGADTRAGAALRAVVAHALGIVVANADALRAGHGGEHLHQARVALRRLRSAMRLFEGIAGPGTAPGIDPRLRWFAHVLGDARDADVLVETTLPGITAASSSKARRRDLLAAARRLHKRALRRAAAAVRSRRYARLVLELAAWSATPAVDDRLAVAALAPTLLDPLADRVTAAAASFTTLPARRRHRVRLQAKRLRYALDLLQATLPRRAAEDYLEALVRLQDTLGELNDIAVARQALRNELPRGAARRELGRWCDEAKPELARRAARELRALARRARPWKDPLTAAPGHRPRRRRG